MAKSLLINPRRRKARKNPSPAQKRARAAFAAAARARSRSANPRRRARSRRRNPISVASAPFINPRRRARRRNPVVIYRGRRRRNPISIGGSSLSINNIMGIAKDGVIMAGGAIAMDLLYAQVARFLPPNLQVTPGQVSLGSGVKLLFTAGAGILLNKYTKGLARKAATGAVVVQARDIMLGMLPPSITGSVQGVGYVSPAGIINQSYRVNSNGRAGLAAYMPGRPPLLNGRAGSMGQYLGPGAGVLLNGRTGARVREGYPR